MGQTALALRLGTYLGSVMATMMQGNSLAQLAVKTGTCPSHTCAKT
jgi:hypothetical protein